MKGSHMNPNLQSIPLRVQHLVHRPQPNNLVLPNYPLVYFYSAEMPYLHTGLATPLLVDNEGNKDLTGQSFLIVWNGSEGEILRSGPNRCNITCIAT